jgi:hypothetical protein
VLWLPAAVVRPGWRVSVDGVIWSRVGRARTDGVTTTITHIDPEDGDDLGATTHAPVDDLDVRIPCDTDGWSEPLALGGWYEVTSLCDCDDPVVCPVADRGEDCQGIVSAAANKQRDADAVRAHMDGGGPR